MDPPSRPVAEPTPAVKPRARRRVRHYAIAALLLAALAVAAVFGARALSSLDPVRDFLIAFPGETPLPDGAPVGLPPWLGWQHFLNAFFLVLIVKTGWQVRTQRRAPATWVRKNTILRTKATPKRISLTLWAHLSFDALWLANGVIFVILLFATGQWLRVVPTSWDVVPNALSAMLQYVSFDWPTENGWVNYNSLQLIAYGITIFIAAPLAALTGFRMSPAWPSSPGLATAFPVEWARRVHLPVMFYFVGFTIVHVALVLATGALRNLNHMYASQDTTAWIGAGVFAASAAVMVGAAFAARPLLLAPIARITGTVSR